MYKWSVHYLPQILLNFLQKLLPGKNSDKILQFLHSRPIFYVVRLYVMTKMNGRCLKE